MIPILQSSSDAQKMHSPKNRPNCKRFKHQVSGLIITFIKRRKNNRDEIVEK